MPGRLSFGLTDYFMPELCLSCALWFLGAKCIVHNWFSLGELPGRLSFGLTDYFMPELCLSCALWFLGAKCIVHNWFSLGEFLHDGYYMTEIHILPDRDCSFDVLCTYTYISHLMRLRLSVFHIQSLAVFLPGVRTCVFLLVLGIISSEWLRTCVIVFVFTGDPCSSPYGGDLTRFVHICWDSAGVEILVQRWSV